MKAVYSLLAALLLAILATGQTTPPASVSYVPYYTVPPLSYSVTVQGQLDGLKTGKADVSSIYLDVEVANYTALQTWVAAHPLSSAIITVNSDINNNNGEGVYRFRKGKLNEIFLL